MVQFLGQREKREVLRQQLYFDTYAKYMVKSIEQLTENIPVYTPSWPAEELCIAPRGKLVRVKKFSFYQSNVIRFEWLLFLERSKKRLEYVQKCHIGTIMDESEIGRQGKTTVEEPVILKYHHELQKGKKNNCLFDSLSLDYWISRNLSKKFEELFRESYE